MLLTPVTNLSITPHMCQVKGQTPLFDSYSHSETVSEVQCRENIVKYKTIGSRTKQNRIQGYAQPHNSKVVLAKSMNILGSLIAYIKLVVLH